MSVELDDITCRELVELVTDYLEGALAPADRTRFEEHLRICKPCVAYVEQIRLTIAAGGAIGAGAARPGGPGRAARRLPRLEARRLEVQVGALRLEAGVPQYPSLAW